MTSKLQKNVQRQEGARDAELGRIQDPLRLPFARILQQVSRIRVSEGYRRMIQMVAASLAQQWDQVQDARRGLDEKDFLVLSRAFDQLVEDMEARPYLDLLGPVYMGIAHKLDRDDRGEFYTPHSVAALLARLAFDETVMRPGEILECNEPAAGTAGMVLAAAEAMTNAGIDPMHTRWVVQDLSQTACYGAYVNLTLWGIPAVVICGDTLRMTRNWAWKNLHWDHAKPWPTEEERRAAIEEALRFEHTISTMRRFLAAS